jgi:hypothetical protein
MIDYSNRTLAYLLIVAIFVSVAGTLVSLSRMTTIGAPLITGAATSGTGAARLTIVSQLAIKLNDSTVDFENCTPDIVGVYWDSNDTARGHLDGGLGNCTGLVNPQNITVENDGNELANVSVKSNLIDLTGGTGPTLWYLTHNSTDNRDGCSQGLRTSWTQIAATDPTEYTACDGLNFSDSMDRFYTYFRVYGPSDATAGQRTATLTFTGYSW